MEAELAARLPPAGAGGAAVQYAISYHVGATDDLRVRAAAIEIELAAFGIGKTVAQVDRSWDERRIAEC